MNYVGDLREITAVPTMPENLIEIVIQKKTKTANEGPSDVNTSLDGVTYPGWKMMRISTHLKNVLVGVTQQAIIRDQ